MRKILTILILVPLLAFSACSKEKNHEVNDFIKAEYQEKKSDLKKEDLKKLKKDIREKTEESSTNRNYISVNDDGFSLLNIKGEEKSKMKKDMSKIELIDFLNNSLFFVENNTLSKITSLNGELNEEVIMPVSGRVSVRYDKDTLYVSTNDGIFKYENNESQNVLNDLNIESFAVRDNLILYKADSFKFYDMSKKELKPTRVGDLKGNIRIASGKNSFLVYTDFNNGIALKVNDIGEIEKVKELNGGKLIRENESYAYFSKNGQIYKLNKDTLEYEFLVNTDNDASFLAENTVIKNGRLLLNDKPIFSVNNKLFLIKGGK